MSLLGRALVLREFGDPSVLEIRDRSVPDPGPGEVRVEVRAAGLNRADLLQRRGLYPAPKGVPADVPGLEYAGTIQSVGRGVRGLRVGDRVFGLVAGGAMATHVLARAPEVLRVPKTMDFVQAAALPEAFLTAWDGFLQAATPHGVGAVLVHAAASGVGTAALQLAKHFFHIPTVIGTGRSAEKLSRCARYGLDVAVVPGPDGWLDAVRAAAPDGVDAVLDLVGGPYVRDDLKALRERGSVVVLGLTGGASVEVPLGLLLSRRLRLVGSVLRSRSPAEKAALTREFVRRVMPLVRAGTLVPVVDAVLPMGSAAEAHARLESNQVVGKLVLTW